MDSKRNPPKPQVDELRAIDPESFRQHLERNHEVVLGTLGGRVVTPQKPGSPGAPGTLGGRVVEPPKQPTAT